MSKQRKPTIIESEVYYSSPAVYTGTTPSTMGPTTDDILPPAGDEYDPLPPYNIQRTKVIEMLVQQRQAIDVYFVGKRRFFNTRRGVVISAKDGNVHYLTIGIEEPVSWTRPSEYRPKYKHLSDLSSGFLKFVREDIAEYWIARSINQSMTEELYREIIHPKGRVKELSEFIRENNECPANPSVLIDFDLFPSYIDETEMNPDRPGVDLDALRQCQSRYFSDDNIEFEYLDILYAIEILTKDCSRTTHRYLKYLQSKSFIFAEIIVALFDFSRKVLLKNVGNLCKVINTRNEKGSVRPTKLPGNPFTFSPETEKKVMEDILLPKLNVLKTITAEPFQKPPREFIKTLIPMAIRNAKKTRNRTIVSPYFRDPLELGAISEYAVIEFVREVQIKDTIASRHEIRNLLLKTDFLAEIMSIIGPELVAREKEWRAKIPEGETVRSFAEKTFPIVGLSILPEHLIKTTALEELRDELKRVVRVKNCAQILIPKESEMKDSIKSLFPYIRKPPKPGSKRHRKILTSTKKT